MGSLIDFYNKNDGFAITKIKGSSKNKMTPILDLEISSQYLCGERNQLNFHIRSNLIRQPFRINSRAEGINCMNPKISHSFNVRPKITLVSVLKVEKQRNINSGMQLVFQKIVAFSCNVVKAHTSSDIEICPNQHYLIHFSLSTNI